MFYALIYPFTDVPEYVFRHSFNYHEIERE